MKADLEQIVQGQPAGCALRIYRTAWGLSQHELGKRVGKSGPAISLIEQGRLQPQPGLRRALAAALRVDEAALFPTGPK